jgi:tagatose 1,6-diphosphate aldolase
MNISPGKLWGLRRLADESGRFKMLAMDQTGPIVNPIKAIRGLDHAPFEDVSAVKKLLARYLTPKASAVLIDPPLGYATAISEIPARTGLILATEWATWEVTETGRKSCNIPGWDAGLIRKVGGDAVKINLWFRSDVGPEIRAHQVAYLDAVKKACTDNDIAFVLEFLTYPFPADTSEEMARRRTELVLSSLSDPDVMDPSGVEVYKLEAPIAVTNVPDPDGPQAAGVQAIFDRMAQGVKRPWVLLSAGAGPEDFMRALTYAYRAGASGYLAGRAIWAEAFAKFPDLAAMEAELKTNAPIVMDALNDLTDRLATPWQNHPGWNGAIEMSPQGQNFAPAYAQEMNDRTATSL